MFDASGIPYVLPYSNRRLSSCVDSLHKKNDENTIDFIDFSIRRIIKQLIFNASGIPYICFLIQIEECPDAVIFFM